MSEGTDKLQKLILSVDKKIRSELELRCRSFSPDPSNPEVFNVLSALLARQGTLAIELSASPQSWNPHAAPLFLRAMADVHITFVWILGDPESRVKQYIQHGLGQSILMLEHKKAAYGDREIDESFKDALEHEEAWINSQRYTFLIDVDFGSWSGKSSRQMADESGLREYYNFVYTTFSQCVHSTWDHVGKMNSRPSPNALTRPFWLPMIRAIQPDQYFLEQAIKCLNETFHAFDEKVLNKSGSVNLRDWLDSEMHLIFSTSSETQETEA